MLCLDGESMEVQFWDHRGSPSACSISGAEITQKPPSYSTHSPARDFPLDLDVPCCGLWAGRAVGQWGEEISQPLPILAYPEQPVSFP